MTNLKSKSQGRAALEVFRTAGQPRLRPFSKPVSLLIDQALTFEERCYVQADFLSAFRHLDNRGALEDLAMGSPKVDR